MFSTPFVEFTVGLRFLQARRSLQMDQQKPTGKPMKKNSTLQIVKAPTTIAAIPITQTAPPAPSHPVTDLPKPARLDTRPWTDDCAEYRDDLMRRYDAPFVCFWDHAGLND